MNAWTKGKSETRKQVHPSIPTRPAGVTYIQIHPS